MKNEDAIRLVKEVTGMSLDWDDDHYEALQLAIDALSAEAIQGEWICKGDYAICSKCGGSSGTQFDGVELIPRITTFCPQCGTRMKGGAE